MKRRILNVVLLLGVMLSLTLVITPNAKAAYDVDSVLEIATEYADNRETSWKDLCLGFVSHCFNKAYGINSSSCCAYNYGSSYIDGTSINNIPLGADVFFSGSDITCSGCGNLCGHVAIYIGDGNVIHSWSGVVQKSSIQYIINCGYPYRGYGWHGDVELAETYLAKCDRYPSYGIVEVTSATTLKSLPCSRGTNAESEDVYTPSIGKQYTVTGIYKNTEGKYWYETTHNGTTCYLYAGNTEFVEYKSDATIKNPVVPTTLKVGEGHNLKGVVSTTYTKLRQVAVSVNLNGKTVDQDYYELGSGNSYDLDGSSVDANIGFSQLGAGEYDLCIYVGLIIYYWDGSKLASVTRWPSVLETTFTVEEGQYLTRCDKYPSYATVKVTTPTTLKTLPCSASTNSKSTDVYTASVGKQYTVTGIYKNTEGNYWYETTHNGTTCYLYAGNTELVELKSSATIKDPVVPTTLKVGEGHNLKGVVSTTHTKLRQVAAHVDRDGTTVDKYYYELGSGNSYDLDGSVVDANIGFSQLSAGKYFLSIYVGEISYYWDGSSLVNKTIWPSLVETYFTVIDDTPSQENPQPVSGFPSVWPTDVSKVYINGLDYYPGGGSHNGIDITTTSSSYRYQDIYAVADGTVYAARNSCTHESQGAGHACPDTWGNYIAIKHAVNGETYYSVYAHLKYNSFTVSSGQSVSAGQKIAQMGSSGGSTGHHLHLEVWKGSWSDKNTLNKYSFDYYKNNPATIDGIKINTSLASTSARYKSWIKDNCESSGGYYVYNHTDSYLDQCTFYPSYATVKVNDETTLKSLPCSRGTNAESEDVYTPSVGKQYTVTGLYKNTEGKYWYETTHYGVPCYLYAGDTELVELLSSATISEASMPDKLSVGQYFPLKGIVSSEYTYLKHVGAKAVVGTENKLWTSAPVDGKSYNLADSYIDDNMTFNTLPTGHYGIVIYVEEYNYYSPDGITKELESLWPEVYRNAFTVGNPGNTTPGKPVITGMKEQYKAGEEIVFNWSTTANTTHYSLYIDRKNEDGTYERINSHYVDPGIAFHLEDGEYKAFLQAVNSRETTDDGSTWDHTDGDWVYFAVGDVTPYLDKCTAYPCYAVVEIARDIMLKTLPCDADTDSRSKDVVTLLQDGNCIVTGLYENDQNEYWYKTEREGVECYPKALWNWRGVRAEH